MHSRDPNAEGAELGREMFQAAVDLFPLHRSSTGEGVRQTLRYLQQWLPLKLHEIPSGTKVLDWTVPREWRIHDAYIADESGQRIVDYRSSNLQVLSGSQPVRGLYRFDELQPHLRWLEQTDDQDRLPYRTAFFQETWGFCVSRRQLARLRQQAEERFQVVIEAELFDGSLTYGEAILPGRSHQFILVYAHCCHPSLANDNLSGVVLAAMLGRAVQQRIDRGEMPEHGYRIVFAPATIGSISWLAVNRDQLSNLVGGLVLTLLGGAGALVYKQSRQTRAAIDRAAELVLQACGRPYRLLPFSPIGYDERQFCSPGFDLPIGCLMRSVPAEFNEYHTSADNLDQLNPTDLAESYRIAQQLLNTLEENGRPVNLQPHGEPQLGRRGLYQSYGSASHHADLQQAVLWVLNLADGQHDLLAIARRSQLPWTAIHQASLLLVQHGLLRMDFDLPSKSRLANDP